MIKSMTGFGRCEHTQGDRKITVEMKAVNHRYLDVNLKMPKQLNPFESAIRTLLKEYIERGKVDLYISYEDGSEGKLHLRYNEELAGEYVSYLNQMAETFQIRNDLTAGHLARFPEVLMMEEQPEDEEELLALIETAVRGACEQFVAARTSEGQHLRDDLVEKLTHMLTLVDEIEKRAPQILTEYREKLKQKVEELLDGTSMEETRLATEVTIFADKICTDEETVRLRSHITGMRDALLSGGGVGRKLDFIAQEMNREANTILSKANDLRTSDLGIELKTEIEKIREQIQNIE